MLDFEVDSLWMVSECCCICNYHSFPSISIIQLFQIFVRVLVGTYVKRESNDMSTDPIKLRIANGYCTFNKVYGMWSVNSMSNGAQTTTRRKDILELRKKQIKET